MRLEQELAVAVALAEEAGRIVMAHRGTAKISAKAGGEPVTEADLAANDVITRGLEKSFPQVPILSEETPADPKRHGAERIWVIDPIDGTREYISGTEDFAIQIGIAERGRSVLGVVYQVAKRRLYWSVEGEGAWLDDPGVEGRARQRLKVTDVADPHQMRMVLSRWHRSKKHTAIAEAVKPARLKPAGSIGVKMCMIALGKAELYLHPSRGTSEWDTCAPDVILREAGGAVTDMFGAPLRYDREIPLHPAGLACSNGKAHAAILATIDPVVRGFGFAPEA